MLSLTVSKILAMLLTGVIPIILGLIPWKVGKYLNSNNIRHQIVVSSLLCYGGGILLGLSLLHMLPEVRETLEEVYPDEGALAETILCVGFFMIYIIEELVHFACDHSLQHDHCEDDHTQSIAVHRAFSTHRSTCDAGELASQSGIESPLAERPSSRVSIRSPSIRSYDSPERNVQAVNVNQTTVANYNTFEDHNSANGLHHGGHSAAGGDDSEAPLVAPGTHTSSVRDFLTVLALSLHAVFEGLAVGLEDSVVTVWTLYAGVAMHKYILAFCVGLELFTAKKNKFIVNVGYVLVFAVMSPIGIGIGIAVTTLLTQDNTAYATTVGVLQGLAAGTLLYVVVFEVLQREKSKQKVPGLLQLFFVLVGFATIFLFVRYGPDV